MLFNSPQHTDTYNLLMIIVHINHNLDTYMFKLIN